MAKKIYTETEGFIAWVVSMLVGLPGLYRLYLRKFRVSTIFYFIPGLGHFLAFFDLLNMRQLVREANLELEYREILEGDGERAAGWADTFDSRTESPRKKTGKISLEQVILQAARRNKGVVTPGEVALEGGISIDEARKYLEKLVSGGYAEMRVRSSGSISYCFPDFFDDAHDRDFEEGL